MDDPPPPSDSSWGGPPPPSGTPGVPPPPPDATPVGRKERPLPLRQMGIGELLDGAIKLYRAEWKVLMGIVAFVLVPLTFLQAYLTRGLPGTFAQEPVVTPDTLDSAIIASSIVGLIQFLFIQPFLTAAVAHAAARVYLGEDVAVGPTYRFAITRVHSILWISILTFLAIAAIMVVVAIPGFLVIAAGGEGAGAVVLVVILFLAAIALVILAAIRLFFASTVLVIEGRKGTKALGRSWRLSKGHFWRLLGTLIVTFLMAGIIASVLAIPGNIAADAIGSQGWPVRALGDSLAAVLTTPFTTLITVLLYFDLRIRKEAFDLEVMAQELPPGQ
jgi:hypothetical protein